MKRYTPWNGGEMIVDPNGDYVRFEDLDTMINTPETISFDKGVVLESIHQIQRWGTDHDAGKTPADWFWLVGYLAGKALAAHIADNREKALHHCISTAAALRNWHAHVRTGSTYMRPGTDQTKNPGV